MSLLIFLLWTVLGSITSDQFPREFTTSSTGLTPGPFYVEVHIRHGLISTVNLLIQ